MEKFKLIRVLLYQRRKSFLVIPSLFAAVCLLISIIDAVRFNDYNFEGMSYLFFYLGVIMVLTVIISALLSFDGKRLDSYPASRLSKVLSRQVVDIVSIVYIVLIWSAAVVVNSLFVFIISKLNGVEMVLNITAKRAIYPILTTLLIVLLAYAAAVFLAALFRWQPVVFLVLTIVCLYIETWSEKPLIGYGLEMLIRNKFFGETAPKVVLIRFGILFLALILISLLVSTLCRNWNARRFNYIYIAAMVVIYIFCGYLPMANGIGAYQDIYTLMGADIGADEPEYADMSREELEGLKLYTFNLMYKDGISREMINRIIEDNYLYICIENRDNDYFYEITQFDSNRLNDKIVISPDEARDLGIEFDDSNLASGGAVLAIGFKTDKKGIEKTLARCLDAAEKDNYIRSIFDNISSVYLQTTERSVVVFVPSLFASYTWKNIKLVPVDTYVRYIIYDI